MSFRTRDFKSPAYAIPPRGLGASAIRPRVISGTGAAGEGRSWLATDRALVGPLDVTRHRGVEAGIVDAAAVLRSAQRRLVADRSERLVGQGGARRVDGAARLLVAPHRAVGFR